MYYVLFDIGGTNTRIALSRDGKSMSEAVTFPTLQDFDEEIEKVKTSIANLLQGEKVHAAAGGIPGTLNKEKTEILSAPNLKGWVRKPLKQELERMLNAPVFLENDAALAGLGEAMEGAGKGYKIVAYITMGTGLGGARIVNGKIDARAWGFEPGHQIIIRDGDECSCGGKGHLEAYVGGWALEKRYQKKPFQINDPAVWDQVARSLAYGLTNTIVHWSPDIVVLGGVCANRVCASPDQIKRYLKNELTVFPEIPEIKKAQLGDAAGLWGALAYLHQKIEKGDRS